MSGSSNVDPSIALQAGRGTTQPENPLQMVGQFANVQNALNANRLFPTQQAILQQTQQSGQANLARQWYQQTSNAVLPLLQKWSANPASAKMSDLTGLLGAVEHNGISTQPYLSRLMALSPTGDGVDLYNSVRGITIPGAQTDAGAATTAVVGSPTSVNTGQAIQPGTMAGAASPNYGSFTPQGAPVQVYPGRGQLIGQVEYVDANGVKQQTTAENYARIAGSGANVGPAVPVGPQSGAPAPASGGSGGPTPVVGIGGPATPQNPPRLAAGTAGTIAGPTPGTPEAATASALSAHAANQRAATFATDMFPLTQAQTALANAPTGKGSQAVHDVSSYINTFSPAWAQKALSFVTLGTAMTPDQVAAYDEAKKYLTQGQLGQTGASRSDAGLSTAGVASPSTTISKEAAQLVLRGMIGLRRMEQEGTLEFNNSGQPPANYDKFMAGFSTAADPRVYTFDQMTPAERQQTLAGLKTPAKIAAFQAAVKRSEDNGIFSAPGPQ
jgi:hypothetical protein